MNAIIFSAIWGVVMLFTGLATTRKLTIRWMAILGMLLLLLLNILEMRGVHLFPFPTRGMFSFELFSLLFNCIMVGVTLLFFLLAGPDIEKVGLHVAEYFALIFFVNCGVSIVSSYSSLLILFLGIEIISIPLFILSGSDKRNLKSNEASLKYFLMGAFSTGLMLMGIAFLYGAKGSFEIDKIAMGSNDFTPLMISCLLLLLFSLSFKVSAAPFHFWTPDVYDGSPTVFTSYMATVVKSAAFIAFFRLFADSFGVQQQRWQLVVAILTAATLLIGNLTAVFQQSVKRMLAYSSIAQAGFMMLALVALNGRAREGLLFYTTAYSLATIGVFAILIRRNDYTFEGFNGMASRQPLLAAVNTIFLLSLAGIPATAGFMAKFYMIAAAVQNGQLMWLVVLAVLCAAISVYYYFRVIQAMYFKPAPAEQDTAPSLFFQGLLVLLAAAILWLGLYPQILTDRLYMLF